MNIKTITITALSLFVIGCANTQPIVDTKGVDMREYAVDLSECQQYAKQIHAGKDAAVDAGIGAAFGWALAKAADRNTKKGVRIGAVTGGAKGLGNAARSKEEIIRRCLRGRGYNVLH